MKADPFWLIQHRLLSRDLEASTHSVGSDDESVSRTEFATCSEECLQATALALSAAMFQCECADRLDSGFDAAGPHLWSAREPCIAREIEFTSLIGMTCPSELASNLGMGARSIV